MSKKISGWMSVVKEDIKVFRLTHPRKGILKYFYFPDFRAVILFRLSQLFNMWTITRPLSFVLTMLNDLITGVWIGPKVTAGPGLSLGHPRGLMVNPSTRIGRNCSILNRVTIGGPNVTIGDNVSINSGATVMSNVRGRGKLAIGNNVIIGAGAVVVSDIPDNSVVVGVPGRVIKSIAPEDNWLDFTIRYNAQKKTETGFKDEE